MNVHFPRPAKILVSHGGIEQWIGGPGFEEATVFDLQNGQVISDIDLVQCGLRLDVASDKSLNFNSVVQVYDSSDLTLVGTFDLPGSTEYVEGIPNLWPGDFLLYFTPGLYERGSTTWRPQWFDRSPDPDQSQVITLGFPGDIALLDVHLEKGGTVWFHDGTSKQTTPFINLQDEVNLQGDRGLLVACGCGSPGRRHCSACAPGRIRALLGVRCQSGRNRRVAALRRVRDRLPGRRIERYLMDVKADARRIAKQQPQAVARYIRLKRTADHPRHDRLVIKAAVGQIGPFENQVFQPSGRLLAVAAEAHAKRLVRHVRPGREVGVDRPVDKRFERFPVERIDAGQCSLNRIGHQLQTHQPIFRRQPSRRRIRARKQRTS